MVKDPRLTRKSFPLQRGENTKRKRTHVSTVGGRVPAMRQQRLAMFGRVRDRADQPLLFQMVAVTSEVHRSGFCTSALHTSVIRLFCTSALHNQSYVCSARLPDRAEERLVSIQPMYNVYIYIYIYVPMFIYMYIHMYVYI